jgi:hypothetical protein
MFMSRHHNAEMMMMMIIIIITIIIADLKKNLEAMPRKHSIDSLQKTAIFGTSHITRKVLHCET